MDSALYTMILLTKIPYRKEFTMDLREILKSKRETLTLEQLPSDVTNVEKVYDIKKDTLIKILNNDGNNFVDSTNILSEVNQLTKNQNEVSFNNSYIHDCVDQYENSPENINQDEVKKLEDNMNLNNLVNKNIQLAILSKESASNIENFNNNLNETLTKTSLVLDQNKQLCVDTFNKVKNVFKETDFSNYINKLLEIREEIFDKDIKHVTCIDHLLEAISNKHEEITENDIYEILDHHSYLFGQLLAPDMKVKQAYMARNHLPEETIRELCKLFKEYIDMSKSYKSSKIFTMSDSKDFIHLYGNIYGTIEKYNTTARSILNGINNIGDLSLYKGLSQEEKINKDKEIINNTIVAFLKNFAMGETFKISEELGPDVTLTNIYFKNGLLYLKGNEYKIVEFDTAVGDSILNLNNYILNGVCDNLETVKDINNNFINGFIDSVLNYLKTQLPNTDESNNLITVNLVLKILVDLVNFFKEDILYKLICVPNMIYNHAIIYKKLIECLEGNKNENNEENIN